MKVNKQFYKSFNFYFYSLFIILWFKPVLEAENLFELTVCSVFLIGSIIAVLWTVFKRPGKELELNRVFYKNIDFYIYIIVTFFWIIAIPKASNIYEEIICILCTAIGIFAALRILFKK
ncbi:hypothetical protein [Limosilactobacillus caviae]|uniref:Uncharacterized protein n=1 Tax=Limosilactobacillus caviae TaxID=1769424 RepID=A0ABQ2C1H8_9LACO|nr:hypothetical protein [Limosilactobacillus caviae]MBC8743837.1 hypothetical protein [Lactobacillus sp. Marseille-P7033]MRH45638.1 hypothetical protein [Limosilactobacillus reuteri]MCD7124718.1 hypothetical protein [Limosilactobacillus caviae]NGC78121.1 hypothetical protein [Limosilactobacillus reuteri]GGI62231.1 hypothetical protein GCM10011459_00650 [Limosilactobacillus caviae]